ncbi:hypothetical protein H4R34_003295 [Dimargaris verticillata]|uniref:Vacuolar protein sorting-associated protein 54 C-terminal domain-containing protein n=1 Tax=Dimargaris verticillata TaxID=2761393 RepID=A0A9W8B0Y8_9FUNG|nr:hypothetical protein H4R34_003295 [Dimargaris verticillata]
MPYPVDPTRTSKGGLDRSKKYLSNEAYMCPNCYTPAVHHVKLSTKFSLFCIPLFPISKGKRYYLCDRCNWASSEGPPQFVQRPPPPPGMAPAGQPDGMLKLCIANMLGQLVILAYLQVQSSVIVHRGLGYRHAMASPPLSAPNSDRRQSTITLSPARRLSLNPATDAQGHSLPTTPVPRPPHRAAWSRASVSGTRPTSARASRAATPNLEPSAAPTHQAPSEGHRSKHAGSDTARSSVGEVLFSHPGWTNRDISLNAIAAILNNPLTKTSGVTKIQKSDLPVVPTTTYRRVKQSDFDGYLTKIARHYEQYCQNKLPLHPQQSSTGPQMSIARPFKQISESKPSSSAPVSPSLSPSSTILPTTHRPSQELALDYLPSFFSRSDLNLSDPRQFEQLCRALAQLPTASGQPPHQILAASHQTAVTPAFVAKAQEGISLCLDAVEQHLTQEISQRSKAFFDALSILQDLHIETDKCIHQIHDLRGQLQQVFRLHCGTGTTLLVLHQRKRNLTQLKEGVAALDELRAVLDHAAILIQQDDLIAAHHLLCDTQRAMGKHMVTPRVATPPSHPAPSSVPSHGPLGVSSQGSPSMATAVIAGQTHQPLLMAKSKAFQQLWRELEATRDSVSASIEQEMTPTIANSLQGFYHECPALSVASVMPTSSDTFPQLSSLPDMDLETVQASLTHQLAPSIRALGRNDRLLPAVQTARDGVLQAIDELLAEMWFRVFPNLAQQAASADIPDTARRRSEDQRLARNLYDGSKYVAKADLSTVVDNQQPWLASVPQMTFDQFLELLFQLFRTFLLALKHDAMVKTAMLAAIDTSQSDSPALGDLTPPNSDCPVRRARLPASNHTAYALKTSTSPPSSPGKPASAAYPEVWSELEDVTFAIAELAHILCVKVIGHRANHTAQLDLKSFYRFYAVSWAYIYESEAWTRKTCFGLRGTLISQAKAFLSHFHMERTKQLALLIENDQWVQKQVPIDFQLMVDKIVKSAILPRHLERLQSVTAGNTGKESQPTDDTTTANTGPCDASNPPLLSSSSPLIATLPTSPARSPVAPERTVPPFLVLEFDGEGPPQSLSDPATTQRWKQRASVDSIVSLLSSNHPDSWYADPELLLSYGSPFESSTTEVSGAADSKKYMEIRGDKFHMVGCSLVLIKILTDYIQCAANIQMLATDVLHRVVEIFKLFNSRVCQVILGAGAMRSAGLKNITAKHIALASQSLGLAMAIIPHVKECLRQIFSAKQETLLAEFDRIIHDLQEHQQELHHKLVAIMTERAQFHGKTIQATDWDIKHPGAKDFNPTPNMELLVKETRTLHKVLGNYLSIPVLQQIMSNVLAMYSRKLEEQVADVVVTTSQGKQRLLADMQYFIGKLSHLDHIEPPKNNLEVMVNNLSVGGASGSTMASSGDHGSPALASRASLSSLPSSDR